MKGNPFANWTMAEVEAHNRRVRKEYGPQVDRVSSRPEPEQAVRDVALGPAPGKESHPGRCVVRIVSFRMRTLDPDNLVGGVKYFVDALCYRKIIPGDRPQDIDLQVSQVKVGAKEDERTEITVTGPVLQDCSGGPREWTIGGPQNKFGTFRDRDGILHSCRYVGPVPPEDFNNEIVVDGLIYVDYCLDDGTPIKNAIIHMNDFMHEY